MADIVVGARQLGYIPGFGPYYHLYIKITNDAGERSYIHAFPNGPGDVGLVDIPLAGSGSAPQQAGELEGRYSPYGEEHADIDNNGSHPTSNPLISGTDAEIQQVVDRMMIDLQSLNDRNTPYNPLLQNSNSVVGELVRDYGFDFVLPIGLDGNSVWAPGSHNHLPELPYSGNYYTDLINDFLKHALLDPIGQAIRDVSHKTNDFINYITDAAKNAKDDLGDLYNDIKDFMRDLLSDPMVLDLDGDGIELTSLANSVTRFDLDEDGVAERTGWVGPDDGLLVHDKNGNGLVDGIAELVGSARVDGFDALAPLDSNADGRIDATDPAFAALRIWRDINANGVSDAGELLTTAEAGIKSFNLTYSEVDRNIAGNTLARLGSYTRLDESTRDMGSVWFTLDQRTTLPEVPAGTDMRPLMALPNLGGSASVPDLRTAMALDGGLKAMVETLITGDFDFATLRAFMAESFEPLLYRWLGVDGPPPVGEEDKPRYMRAIEALTGQIIPLDELNIHQQERLGEVGTQWGNAVVGLAIQFLVQAAQMPVRQAYLNVGEAISALDPDAPTYADQFNAILATLDADLVAVEPPPGIAAPYALLSIDPVTGKLIGDFDAFAAEIIKDQPSFWSGFYSSTGGGGGGSGAVSVSVSVSVSGSGTEAEFSHPWTEWYHKQGIFLFNVAAAMEIEPDYVKNVTGWQWLFGEATDHSGTINNDILDFNVTYYSTSGVYGIIPTIDQRIFGYEGDDELRGNAGVDRLVGGSGNDILKGGLDSDMYVYSAGDGLDRIIEEDGQSDAIYFSSEFDAADLKVSRAAGTNDLLLHFGDPAQGIILENQWSSSAIEQLHFVAEDGLNAADIASRYLATLATSGADAISGSWAGETLIGLDGNDSLYALDGNDVVDGGAGNDMLDGGEGNDLLIGGDGDDVFEGAGGNDRMVGGRGNDTYREYAGDDVYVWQPGEGDDLITGGIYWDGFNTIEFGAGVAPTDLVYEYFNNRGGLKISVRGQAGSIAIDWQLAGDTTERIDELRFADGSVLTRAQFTAAALAQFATTGNDDLMGSGGNDAMSGLDGDDRLDPRHGDDVLIGGLGNDVLVETDGNDTYYWSLGDGDDLVTGGIYWDDYDTLAFGAGIAASDLRFIAVNDGWGIKVSVAGHAGSITLDGQMDGNPDITDKQIDRFLFADGASLSRRQINDLAILQMMTPADDVIRGSMGDDTIQGGNGNDTLDGRNGNDVLIGGSGNDTISESDGNDTYVWNIGDGDDRLVGGIYWDDYDTLSFGLGIALADLRFVAVNDGWGIKISVFGQAGSITIDGQMDGNPDITDKHIDRFMFADGSSLTRRQINDVVLQQMMTPADDLIRGSKGDDTLQGGDGNDTLDGREGADIFVGGLGNDTVIEGVGNDTIVWNIGDGDDHVTGNYWYGYNAIQLGAGISEADVIISVSSYGQSDLRVGFYGFAGSITLSEWRSDNVNVEEIRFSNGTIWSKQQILDRIVFDPFIRGTTGNDSLALPNDFVRVDVGTGDDYLSVNGSGGGDVLFRRGSGHYTLDNLSSGYHRDDALVLEGLMPSDIDLTRDADRLRVTVLATGDTFDARWQFSGGNQDYGLGKIRFTNGIEWNRAEIADAAFVRGTAGDDSIGLPYDYANLDAGAGNDYISVSGNGGGRILFDQGSGHDTLDNDGYGYQRDDTLVLASLDPQDVILQRNGDQLSFTIADSGETFMVRWQFWGNGQTYGLGGVRFADGAEWDRTAILQRVTAATDGADTFVGSSETDYLRGLQGDDVIDGRAGNDELWGDSGFDQLFGGLGNDVIAGGSGSDMLTGGLGADSFLFRSGDTGNTASLADKILDFSGAEGDKIVIDLIDAKPETPADDAFALIGTGVFTGAAGQLRYEVIGPNTFVQGDLDGDAVADFMILLSGAVTLVAGDFVL
jgi:Ca2+-binding RTX toxin-like protein